MSGNLNRVVWIAVAVSAAVGLAVVIVLLRGDPSYLIQARTRAGVPYGVPAPVPFAFRAFTATVLVASLLSAGKRAVSEAGMLLWPLALLGYVLFALDVVVSATLGPMFPAFLTIAWFSLLLPPIMYSEPLGDQLTGAIPCPQWLIGALCILALAARLVWSAFLRSPMA